MHELRNCPMPLLSQYHYHANDHTCMTKIMKTSSYISIQYQFGWQRALNPTSPKSKFSIWSFEHSISYQEIFSSNLNIVIPQSSSFTTPELPSSSGCPGAHPSNEAVFSKGMKYQNHYTGNILQQFSIVYLHRKTYLRVSDTNYL